MNNDKKKHSVCNNTLSMFFTIFFKNKEEIIYYHINSINSTKNHNLI